MDPWPTQEDRPTGLRPPFRIFGSDIVADCLRAFEIDYIALTPLPELAGLHDSLVNFTGNAKPRLLPCFDASHAIDLARGYARATGMPMAVTISEPALVQDQLRALRREGVPLLVFTPGSNGVSDAFTAVLEPESPNDIFDLLVEARAACLRPDGPGPVCVRLPHALMEAECSDTSHRRRPFISLPHVCGGLSVDHAKEIARILEDAGPLVILAGAMGHRAEDWSALVILAEHFGASVVTCQGTRAAFDSRHPLHAGCVGGSGHDRALAACVSADVVLAFCWQEWSVLAGGVGESLRRRSFLIEAGPLRLSYADASGRYSSTGLPDMICSARVADFLRDLPIDFVPGTMKRSLGGTDRKARPADLADALQESLSGEALTLAHTPAHLTELDWPAKEPLGHLGTADRGGIGVTIGAALALEGQGRLVTGVVDSEDFIAGAAALWMATYLGLSLLLLVSGGNSRPNVAMRQANIARQRGRSEDNQSIGAELAKPAIDITALAQSFGADLVPPHGLGSDLSDRLRDAASRVRSGKVVVLVLAD